MVVGCVMSTKLTILNFVQIENAAFVTRVVATKKPTTTTKATPSKKPEQPIINENDRKKNQFKPVSGAKPVASGPPPTKVSVNGVTFSSCIFDSSPGDGTIKLYGLRKSRKFTNQFSLYAFLLNSRKNYQHHLPKICCIVHHTLHFLLFHEKEARNV